jgi:hypothetical protein
MQLTQRSQTFLQADQTWLGSEHGTTNARSVTIVTASLTKATHYPNGFIPSGTPLAQYTAGANQGKYTAYTSGGANGAGTLVGFLLDSVPVHYGAESVDVSGALLDHGRIVLAKLPIPVDAAGQSAVAGRLWFV